MWLSNPFSLSNTLSHTHTHLPIAGLKNLEGLHGSCWRFSTAPPVRGIGDAANLLSQVPQVFSDAFDDVSSKSIKRALLSRGVVCWPLLPVRKLLLDPSSSRQNPASEYIVKSLSSGSISTSCPSPRVGQRLIPRSCTEAVSHPPLLPVVAGLLLASSVDITSCLSRRERPVPPSTLEVIDEPGSSKPFPIGSKTRDITVLRASFLTRCSLYSSAENDGHWSFSI
ncbi:hypothetical protein I7I48_01325 [Histoplasma ohiense]|nr:hypothetical protein I7I48_01325 [Histoplasma ohiense (nom. inval.)]